MHAPSGSTAASDPTKRGQRGGVSGEGGMDTLYGRGRVGVGREGWGWGYEGRSAGGGGEAANASLIMTLQEKEDGPVCVATSRPPLVIAGSEQPTVGGVGASGGLLNRQIRKRHTWSRLLWHQRVDTNQCIAIIFWVHGGLSTCPERRIRDGVSGEGRRAGGRARGGGGSRDG